MTSVHLWLVNTHWDMSKIGHGCAMFFIELQTKHLHRTDRLFTIQLIPVAVTTSVRGQCGIQLGIMSI